MLETCGEGAGSTKLSFQNRSKGGESTIPKSPFLKLGNSGSTFDCKPTNELSLSKQKDPVSDGSSGVCVKGSNWTTGSSHLGGGGSTVVVTGEADLLGGSEKGGIEEF